MGTHKQETSSCVADPNLKNWLGVFLVMHRCQAGNIWRKNNPYILESLGSRHEDLLCLHCAKDHLLWKWWSSGKAAQCWGQSIVPPQESLKPVKSHSSMSLLTIVQVVSKILFVHVSAA